MVGCINIAEKQTDVLGSLFRQIQIERSPRFQDLAAVLLDGQLRAATVHLRQMLLHQTDLVENLLLTLGDGKKLNGIHLTAAGKHLFLDWLEQIRLMDGHFQP